jgi:hypothetical protein
MSKQTIAIETNKNIIHTDSRSPSSPRTPATRSRRSRNGNAGASTGDPHLDLTQHCSHERPPILSRRGPRCRVNRSVDISTTTYASTDASARSHVQETETESKAFFNQYQANRYPNIFNRPSHSFEDSSRTSSILPATLDGRWCIPLQPGWGRTIFTPRPIHPSPKSEPSDVASRQS